MEEEYTTTFNVYKEEKTKIIEQLKNFNGDNETKNQLLHNLLFIDETLDKYRKKINKDNI